MGSYNSHLSNLFIYIFFCIFFKKKLNSDRVQSEVDEPEPLKVRFDD